MKLNKKNHLRILEIGTELNKPLLWTDTNLTHCLSVNPETTTLFLDRLALNPLKRSLEAMASAIFCFLVSAIVILISTEVFKYFGLNV